jgi:choice-of-anchor A domain-containing protein
MPSPAWSSERGVALLVSLLVVLLLSVLSAGIIFVSSQEVQASTNYRTLSQATYVAEAGLQRAVEWFTYTYPTLPGASTIANFNTACYPAVPAGAACGTDPVLLAGLPGSTATHPVAGIQQVFLQNLADQALAAGTFEGSYSVDAQLLAVTQVMVGIVPPLQTRTREKWLVTSRGAIDRGTEQAGVVETAVLERLFRSYFDFALYGICSATMTGDTRTDSFNSDLGPYAVGNQSALGAGVGSNGRVSTQGLSLEVGGDVSFGPGAAGCPAGDPSFVSPVVVNGTISAAPPRTFPPLPAVTWGGANVTLSSSTTQSLAPGSYGAVELSGSSSIVLSGSADPDVPNVYNFESLSLTGSNTTISISPPGSSVSINVRGTAISPNPSSQCSGAGQTTGLYLGGTGIFSGTPPPPPRTVSVNYYGTNCMAVAGGSSVSAMIYAPNATVFLVGSGQSYGAVVAKHVEMLGNRSLHYDRSMMDERGTLSPIQVVGFSRPKF